MSGSLLGRVWVLLGISYLSTAVAGEAEHPTDPHHDGCDLSRYGGVQHSRGVRLAFLTAPSYRLARSLRHRASIAGSRASAGPCFLEAKRCGTNHTGRGATTAGVNAR